MGLLEGKKGLILGLANDRSIAWGIAQAFHREGAQLGFNYIDAVESRVRPLAESLGARMIERCDVSRDEDIAALMARAGETFGTIDFLIHAVAFAKKEELGGSILDTSREGFRIALDISCYSLLAVTRAAQPILAPGASVLTLSYHGARAVVNAYNVMGVAKAALEATVRYMAAHMGPDGHRVNAISAGPIRTLAASGISGFRDLHRQFADVAPLRRNVTIEDVGNAAVYLCSNLSAGVTGEIHYVDAGYNVLSLGNDGTSG